MILEDIKIGDIIVELDEVDFDILFISRVSDIIKDKLITDNYIDYPTGNMCMNTGGITLFSELKDCYPANKEQIIWFEYCESLAEYVSYEDFETIQVKEFIQEHKLL